MKKASMPTDRLTKTVGTRFRWWLLRRITAHLSRYGTLPPALMPLHIRACYIEGDSNIFLESCALADLMGRTYPTSAYSTGPYSKIALTAYARLSRLYMKECSDV